MGLGGFLHQRAFARRSAQESFLRLTCGVPLRHDARVPMRFDPRIFRYRRSERLDWQLGFHAHRSFRASPRLIPLSKERQSAHGAVRAVRPNASHPEREPPRCLEETYLRMFHTLLFWRVPRPAPIAGPVFELSL